MIGAAHQVLVGDQIVKNKMGGGHMAGTEERKVHTEWWWGRDSLAHIDVYGGIILKIIRKE